MYGGLEPEVAPSYLKKNSNPYLLRKISKKYRRHGT